MSRVIIDNVKKIIVSLQRREQKLIEAITRDDTASVQKLLEQGVDPNLKTTSDTSKNIISKANSQASEPIIFLAFVKKSFTLPEGLICDRPSASYNLTAQEECLRLLLKAGAEPNARDNQGRTALEIAILWCMPDIVKLLLLNGADPNLQNQNGKTPLMMTAILGIQDARPMRDKLQIIKHLIDSGAEIDAQSPSGKTALMYATGNARLEIVELLVSSGASLLITDHQGNQARNIIGRGVTAAQRNHLHQILDQPQMSIAKYQKLIPEGDHILELILQKHQQ